MTPRHLCFCSLTLYCFAQLQLAGANELSFLTTSKLAMSSQVARLAAAARAALWAHPHDFRGTLQADVARSAEQPAGDTRALSEMVANLKALPNVGGSADENYDSSHSYDMWNPHVPPCPTCPLPRLQAQWSQGDDGSSTEIGRKPSGIRLNLDDETSTVASAERAAGEQPTAATLAAVIPRSAAISAGTILGLACVVATTRHLCKRSSPAAMGRFSMRSPRLAVAPATHGPDVRPIAADLHCASTAPSAATQLRRATSVSELVMSK